MTLRGRGMVAALLAVTTLVAITLASPQPSAQEPKTGVEPEIEPEVDPGAAPELLVVPQAPTEPVARYPLPAQAFVDRTLRLRSYTDGEIRQIAQSPVVAFQLRLLLSAESVPPVQKIRALNPDVVIIGIHGVCDYMSSWEHVNARKRFPMCAELYDLLEPHTAKRTDGEVATMWTERPMMNPWHADGGHDQALLDEMLDIIARYAAMYPGAFDGVLHDYLSPLPYVYPQPADPTAKVDLNGNGVAANEDAEDRAVWVGWQAALIDGFQNRFGPGLIQIGNGRLPHVDPQIAHRLAGIAYENFPHLVWRSNDRDSVELVIKHLEPGYLTPRRGRVWSLLWDDQGRRPDFARLASLLTGQLYGLNETEGWPAADALAGSWGQPEGDLVEEGTADGGVRWSREFSRGPAWLEVSSGGETSRIAFPDR